MRIQAEPLEQLRSSSSTETHFESQRATVVRLADISVAYEGKAGRVAALKGLDLKVAQGEVVAIVGPSGCGKSTLLSIVAGLLEPDSGLVEIAEPVALMPQRDLLLPWRSALANAALALEAQGVPKREALSQAHPLFERFGLASFERAQTHELSGGMRQRIAFARTVLSGRPMLALDEPFGLLDALARGQMHEWLIDALATTPRTVLLVTHDVDEALTLADRVVMLSARPGRAVAEFSIKRPVEASRIEWITSEPFAKHKREALEVLVER